MLVDPFWMGVMSTVLVELVIIFIAALIWGRRK